MHAPEPFSRLGVVGAQSKGLHVCARLRAFKATLLRFCLPDVTPLDAAVSAVRDAPRRICLSAVIPAPPPHVPQDGLPSTTSLTTVIMNVPPPRRQAQTLALLAAWDVARGLEYLHAAGVVHGDINGARARALCLLAGDCVCVNACAG